MTRRFTTVSSFVIRPGSTVSSVRLRQQQMQPQAQARDRQRATAGRSLFSLTNDKEQQHRATTRTTTRGKPSDSSRTIQEQNQHDDIINNDGNSNSNSTTTMKTSTLCFGFPQDVASPLALLLFSQFILFIGVGAVIPSIPLYGKEIGLSGATNGIVISAPAVSSLLLAQAAGKFADVARKPAMLWGMAIIVASDVGTALAGGLPTLALARLGLGCGRIVSESGERGMLADLAGRAPSLRGRALALQQTVLALGIAIGAPLGGYVVEDHGPRASFLCVSAAAAVALFLYLFLPETTRTTTTTTTAGANDDGLFHNNGDAPATAQDDTATDDKNTNYHSDNERNESTKHAAGGDWTRLLQESKWRGLALCQVGASCGFAAKIASIPILAADTLPGGAVGAGALLSAAGLSGLIGAPIGGWLTDKTSARLTVILSGIVSACGLLLIPFALHSLSFGEETMVSFWFHNFGGEQHAAAVTMSGQALAFSLVVLLWSIGAAAQGPALTALAQELAPPGAEATAMALPRAAGDGTYIVAPLLLGLVSDSDMAVSGTDCAVAGVAGLLGVCALALLGDNGSSRNGLTTKMTSYYD